METRLFLFIPLYPAFCNISNSDFFIDKFSENGQS